jgi:hypothetical protein
MNIMSIFTNTTCTFEWVQENNIFDFMVKIMLIVFWMPFIEQAYSHFKTKNIGRMHRFDAKARLPLFKEKTQITVKILNIIRLLVYILLYCKIWLQTCGRVKKLKYLHSRTEQKDDEICLLNQRNCMDSVKIYSIFRLLANKSQANVCTVLPCNNFFVHAGRCEISPELRRHAAG